MHLRLPVTPRSIPRSSRARVHARVKRIVPLLLAGCALVLGAVASGTTSADTAAAATAPPNTITVRGERWFALGASVPYVARSCDFGCGRTNGLRARRAVADRMLRDASRRGVRVVRWYVASGDGTNQIRRSTDGTPTKVTSATRFDLDVAAELAAKHDVYLLPVLLPNPAQAPSTWFTDPAQAVALAEAVRPLIARHASNRHVLGWELVSGAERLVDHGVATPEQLRAHAAALLAMHHATAPRQLAAIGTIDVSRLDTWTGLGAELYLPQDMGPRSGDACAECTSVAQLAEREGVDAPVVIGGFRAGSAAVAERRVRAYARAGYAGALAWSIRGRAHPDAARSARKFPVVGLWRYHYDRALSGPRSRVLNPCLGPDARRLYRCPNLRMSVPRDVRLGRTRGRAILYSTNSLDSVGAGPASLRGTRSGKLTMRARQLLHRRRGKPVSVNTGAKLLFKAIPGQYRYWKWNGAARMELWRLDSTGRPISRARTGPKTVYCLRDLKRTRGHLPRSPRSRQFPGCSQRLSQRRVTLGTSVGWSDVYPASYFENWVDVTGLRGCFAYVHIADPDNVMYESNEDDNTSHVVVKLPFTGSNRGCPGAKPLPVSGADGW